MASSKRTKGAVRAYTVGPKASRAQKAMQREPYDPEAPVRIRGERRVGGVVKAFVLGAPIGAEIRPSNKLQPLDEETRRLARAGAIAPPYPPYELCQRVEESTALQPAIACMVANVHGHGYRFEPLFDMHADSTRDVVKQAISLERLRSGGWESEDAFSPSDVDVDLRMRRIERRMQFEKMKLDALFSACVPGSSFEILKQKLGADREATGGSYLGCRRTLGGDLVEFEYLPSASMRLRPIIRDRNGDPDWVDVQTPVRRTPISYELQPVPRLFRTFVQLGFTSEVYYKEFGDPRTVSARDGSVYACEDDLPRGHRAATEVFYHPIHAPLYTYGTPRWIAATPVMSGLRDAQEVNADLFKNNAVPRWMLLVSGGALRTGAEETIKQHIASTIKGKANYHNILIVEATPPQTAPTARVQIEAVPMRANVQEDGLFQRYELQAAATIWSQFRFPKLLLGLAEDINRATSQAVLEFVETQICQPERAGFDTMVNAILMHEDILYWKFVSNSPLARAPKDVADLAKIFGDSGAATVNDLRSLMTEALNKPFARIEEPWGDLPKFLTEAGLQQGQPGGTSMIGGESKTGVASVAKDAAGPPPRRIVKAASPRDLADWLVRARDHLQRSADDAFAIEIQHARGTSLVVPMLKQQLDELVQR